MMKVVHLVESMGAGVLRYLQEITAEGDERGFRHYIIHSKRQYTPDNLSDYFSTDVALIYVPMETNVSLKKDVSAIGQILKHWGEIEPDIIHLHSSKAGFLGRLAAPFFKKKVRLFYTPHGYSFLMNSRKMSTRVIYFLAEAILALFPGHTIACSKSEFLYAKILCPWGRNFLLENATRKLSRKPKEHIPNEITLISVGRMDEQKDPLLFLDVVKQLQQNGVRCKAVWVGDGPLRGNCEEIAERQQIHVRFTGWLDHPQVVEELSGADLYLQTSRWEGLPYSVLEAFALGIPVIATDIRSHKDIIINGINGYLGKDSPQLAEYILKLFNDKKLYSELTRQTLERFRSHYSFEVFMRKLSSIYQDNR